MLVKTKNYNPAFPRIYKEAASPAVRATLYILSSSIAPKKQCVLGTSNTPPAKVGHLRIGSGGGGVLRNPTIPKGG